jgi:hypothetical protein
VAQVKLEMHKAAPPKIEISARVTWNSCFEKTCLKRYRAQRQSSTALRQSIKGGQTNVRGCGVRVTFKASVVAACVTAACREITEIPTKSLILINSLVSVGSERI